MRILGYDVDPVTGAKVTTGAEDGKLLVYTERDVEPALDYTRSLRNAPQYSKTGIKQNFMHAIHIPDVVAAKMITEDGFDVYKQPAREIRKFLRKNREKYGYLFVTAGQV